VNLRAGLSNEQGILTSRQWLLVFAAGALATAISYPFYGFISPWIGAGIFVTVATFVHLQYASRTIVPFPHFAIFIGALQYVLAAWFSLYHPPRDPTYNIAGQVAEYFAYGGPVVLSYAAGWALSLLWLKKPLKAYQITQPSQALLNELDAVSLAGIAALLASRVIKIQSLSFVLLLFGNLRYVGIYGRMVLQGKGWQWRIAIVLALEVILATGAAMFHSLLLWCLWTFAIWLFSFQPRLPVKIIAIAVGILLLPTIQEAKWELRGEGDKPLQEADTLVEPTAIDKTVLWISYLGPSTLKTLTINLEEDFLGDMAVRYNQGWIVNRTMQWVPTYEPFARGSTILEAAKGSLLPRLLAPEKERAGGQEGMARFAGLDLGEDTSMTLGSAGEMYANFGVIGGIVGCGIYALGFGILFRVICRRALVGPLWWSIVPFIFYSSVKAEDDIAFVLNWTVKSSLLIAGLIFVLPNIRRALFQRQKISRAITRTENTFEVQ
jgi:hypothetical protein